MRLNRAHRLLGIVLLCPMIAWAITGLVFFIKPGYSGAYEMPSVKTYPLDVTARVIPQPAWLEYRYLRTVLGDHVIVRTAAGWQHLDPRTLLPRPAPTDDELTTLLADALSANPERYGRIIGVAGNRVTTDNGVEVTLDWQQMRLQQHGRDTGNIDLLYRIHYLQWTGVAEIDKVLGGLGLILLLALSALGARLVFRKR